MRSGPSIHSRIRNLDRRRLRSSRTVGRGSPKWNTSVIASCSPSIGLEARPIMCRNGTKTDFGTMTKPGRRAAMDDARLRGAVDRGDGHRRITRHGHHISDRRRCRGGAKGSARIFLRRQGPDRRPCGEQCIDHTEFEGSQRSAYGHKAERIRPHGVHLGTISYHSNRTL